MNQYLLNRVRFVSVSDVCGVYLLTDTVRGSTYVGASKRVKTRVGQHFSAMEKQDPGATYRNFKQTFAEQGPKAFDVRLLQECSAQGLAEAERKWIAELQPSENSYACVDGRRVYDEEVRGKKSRIVAELWATPGYREKAVAARKGKAYATGYRCTPEQRLNRQKAARISNMKRNYADQWQQEYLRRYPQHAGDIHVN